MSSDKLYGHFEEVLRDQHNGDNRWYAIHAEHMTSEGLHAKSEIAAELAYRDAKIEELKGSVAGAEDCLWWSETGRTELKKRIEELESLLKEAAFLLRAVDVETTHFARMRERMNLWTRIQEITENE